MDNTPYNLARFDLVSVRLAVLCGQTGSLTAAAHRCHLAVSAASRRLNDLEAVLGDTLFERHSRGLSPTVAGQAFLRHAMAMLQGVQNLVGELADLRQGVARHIRVCASTAAISGFLPPLLASHEKAHPHIRVDVEEHMSDGVVAAVMEGRADLGVFVEGPAVGDLETAVFAHDELVLLLPAGHRLAGRQSISFADTLDEPWISLEHGAALLRAQQNAALTAGRGLKLRMQVRSFDAVCHMVASGLGIALLPKGAALALTGRRKLTSRPLADPWARRRLLVATPPQADAVVAGLRDFLGLRSRKRNAASFKRQ